jgi:hypothetical protein
MGVQERSLNWIVKNQRFSREFLRPGARLSEAKSPPLAESVDVTEVSLFTRQADFLHLG